MEINELKVRGKKTPCYIWPQCYRWSHSKHPHGVFVLVLVSVGVGVNVLYTFNANLTHKDAEQANLYSPMS